MEELRAKGLAPASSKPTIVEVHPYEDLLWAWNGFWRLSISRPQNMSGPSRLPPSEILAYAKLQGMSQEKYQDFLFYIDVLDGKFMEFIEAEQEKDKKRREQEQRVAAAGAQRRR